MSQWDQMALHKLHEAVANSTAFLSLLTEHYKEDPTCLIELGYAIMLDKPIYLLVKKGTTIPAALIRLADRVEFYAATEDVELAAHRLLKDLLPRKED